MKKIIAFTLAELVVTLSIVGVIASIILPAIKNTSPNKEMVMFKKSYGNFARISTMLVNDDEFYPEKPGGEESNYFGNTDTITFKGNEYAGTTKLCGLMAAHLSIIGTVNCSATAFSNGNGSFKTADGVVWLLPPNDFSKNETVVVQLDVNNSAGNNQYHGTGATNPDRFSFTLYRDGRIVPNCLESLYLEESNVSKKYKDMDFTKCATSAS